jgi:hypothetical protein
MYFHAKQRKKEPHFKEVLKVRSFLKKFLA